MGKVLLRIFIVSVYAYLVLRMIRLSLPDNIEINLPLAKVWMLLIYLFVFNLNTEGSLFIDRILDKKLPWYYAMRKRLIVQFAAVVLWSLVIIGLPVTLWYFKNGGSLIYPPTSVIVFLSSIIIIFAFVGISMIRNFYTQKSNSLLEIEHLKQEKLKADYRVLQNQVNPHFLFNSLNVLISEIKHKPDTAIEFTRKLSKVYRYVLQSRNHELIGLKEEIECIESFIFLHKVRMGNALNFDLQVSDEALNMKLPPLTLQILVENAIKHNVANEENVLSITISNPREFKLEVKNNLNPKSDLNSTHTGLSNIRSRYALLKKGEIEVVRTLEEFIVLVPLIED
jgi:sensor histidine kinase YesM